MSKNNISDRMSGGAQASDPRHLIRLQVNNIIGGASHVDVGGGGRGISHSLSDTHFVRNFADETGYSRGSHPNFSFYSHFYEIK